MDKFTVLIDLVKSQARPNFTQAQLAIEELAWKLGLELKSEQERAELIAAKVQAFRLLRECMEQKYELASMNSYIQ